MKNILIAFCAFIARRFNRFWDRFDTYELYQPSVMSEVEGKKLASGAQPLLEEAVAPEAQTVHASKASAISVSSMVKGRRRRRNGLGSGLDKYIARIKRDVNRKRRELYETKNQGQNGDFRYRR